MNTVLFDLDGTLLGLDNDEFVEAYVKELGLYAASLGLEPQSFAKSMLKAVLGMFGNDGSCSNEELFWRLANQLYPGLPADAAAKVDEFYASEAFTRLLDSIATPLAASAQSVRVLKAKGYRVAIATNPLFARIATLRRVRYAGLCPEDFELISTYEDYHFCKPNPQYYLEFCQRMGVDPKDCTMVGNDVDEDMVAAKLGMEVFLVTPYLLNRHHLDTSVFQQGSMDDVLVWAETLPSLI